MKIHTLIAVSMLFSLSACNELLDLIKEDVNSIELDNQLSILIEQHNMNDTISGESNLPDISSPIAQLGKKLFFSQSLSGDLNVACASCHHPALAGADALSLSIGANAVDSDVLGGGRLAIDNDFDVGRNAPTVFNTGLWRDGLFWDSRVEFVQGGISTPDSNFETVDLNAGSTLAAAQAKFPVTSNSEMLGDEFAQFENNDGVRDHLAQRMGNYGLHINVFDTNQWLTEFQLGFDSSESSEVLITFNNIAFAMGEYERSMLFVDSPWRQYVNGDINALSDSQKRGAQLFLTDDNNNGANCVQCHQGPTFTDERFNLVAFPQFGIKTNDDQGDIGREAVSNNQNDRYRFRTASLLNVELTAPYGHAGTYQTLEEVVAHYDNPRESVEDFFVENKMCDLTQFKNIENCDSIFNNAQNISMAALQEIGQRRRPGRNGSGSTLDNIQLNQDEQNDIVEFLRALTDVCASDLDCLTPWIADNVLDNPDGQMLKAKF
ncbi:MAG: cytochrome C peroxidase [Saccharospirillaceae bacterium]|nr:hypothetical protein [Pseudomonadales bacterium]NRB77526.1 cytochrome C peroxidase [Saccharospirillaceae bacterium]